MIGVEEIIIKAIDANIEDFRQDSKELEKVIPKLEQQRNVVSEVSNELHKATKEVESIYYSTGIRIQNKDLIEAMGYYNTNSYCKATVKRYAGLSQYGSAISKWESANTKYDRESEKLIKIQTKYRDLRVVKLFDETIIKYLILWGYVTKFKDIYNPNKIEQIVVEGPITLPLNPMVPQFYINSKKYVDENSGCIDHKFESNEVIYEMSTEYIDYLFSQPISLFKNFKESIHNKIRFYRAITVFV